MSSFTAVGMAPADLTGPPGFTTLNIDNPMNNNFTTLHASLHVAFADRELEKRIIAAVSRDPNLADLFEDIAQNVMHSRGQGTSQMPPSPNKKRKIERDVEEGQKMNEAYGLGRETQIVIDRPQTVFSCKDVSFQMPVRKKVRLEIRADPKKPAQQEVFLANQADDEVEHLLPAGWIEQAFCMPVPDKQQRQKQFVLYPNEEGDGRGPFVFALNETKVAEGVVDTCLRDDVQEGDTYATVTERALKRMLRGYGKSLVRPTDAEFASAIPQSHRKGEKGYHVRAHVGSKEGYLFFLPVGIFFGFKKPLAYFPFERIDSISYTSVLQRTFNLVVTHTTTTSGEAKGEETKETEFSMLDQADFAGIDEYVKRHGLNDASMAAQRRAKAYNVNKPKGGADAGADGAQMNGGGANGEGEESELARAEQALQDAEDEEEEDYEASGGESDGEGEESSEDEDGGGGDGEYDEEEDEEEEDGTR